MRDYRALRGRIVEQYGNLTGLCKETGEKKKIVFGLTGTGYFDMVAYGKFNDGLMDDYIPTDEELALSIAKLPKIN